MTTHLSISVGIFPKGNQLLIQQSCMILHLDLVLTGRVIPVILDGTSHSANRLRTQQCCLILPHHRVSSRTTPLLSNSNGIFPRVSLLQTQQRCWIQPLRWGSSVKEIPPQWILWRQTNRRRLLPQWHHPPTHLLSFGMSRRSHRLPQCCLYHLHRRR